MKLLLQRRHERGAAVTLFREFFPPAALAPYVSRFWTTTGGDAHGLPLCSRVLPDGCTDLLFDLSSSPQALVIGPMLQPRLALSRAVENIAVSFYPGRIFPFLGHPLSDLREKVVGLEPFWGESSANLLDRLTEAPDTASRIKILERELLARLPGNYRQEVHVHRAVACLYANRGNVSMRNLTQVVALCERQLRRKLIAWTGYGPKQLGRIVRFQHSARTLLNARGANGADIAVSHDYADQAHLVHEFKALSGLTPRDFKFAALERQAECPILSIPTPGAMMYS